MKNNKLVKKAEFVVNILFFITCILPLSSKISRFWDIYLLGEVRIYTFDFPLVLLIVFFAVRLIQESKLKINNFKGNYLFGIFVGLVTLSTFFGVSINSFSINDLLIWPRVLFVFIYFQNTEVFSHNEDIFKKLIYCLVVFLLIVSFVQIATRSEIGSLSRYVGSTKGIRQGSWEWFRVRATFPNTNVFGQVMLILLSLVYLSYLHKKGIIDLVLLIGGVVAVFFTSSRGLILSLLGMFIGGAVIYRREKELKIKQIFIKGVILAVCFSLIFSFMFKDFFLKNITRFGKILNYKESKSLYSRVFYIQLGVKVIIDYPLWGVGFHNLSKVVHDYYEKVPNSVAFTDDTSVHNILFLLLTETGIISTIIFILLIWRLLLIYLRNKKGFYAQYGLLIMVLYLINSMWYMSPFDPYILILFFSINGLLINFNQSRCNAPY